MNIELLNGDCLVLLEKIEDNSIDSIITDPPYEIGFMGKKWDNSGIAYNIELWKECLRVLKPGGYLLSFSSTRTYHRMAVAIEDAGFEIRDMLEYVYGTGFPKSMDVGKAIDKLQGNIRSVIGTEKVDKGIQSGSMHSGRSVNIVERDVTKGNSAWEGFGTALKPSHEPICMARKPLSEKTVAENCLKWNTGAINIQDCRIGENGRFPANLILDDSDEVKDCFPNDNEKFFKTIIYETKPSKKERGEYNHHPTVKPVKLMEYLILMVTPENGIVLDPFLGSGTTGIASINMNKHFIGMELNDDYLNISKIRIDEVLKQKSEELF